MLEQTAPQPGCGCFQALPDRSGPSAFLFAPTLKSDWRVFEPGSVAETYRASGVQVAQALKVSRDRWVRAWGAVRSGGGMARRRRGRGIIVEVAGLPRVGGRLKR